MTTRPPCRRHPTTAHQLPSRDQGRHLCSNRRLRLRLPARSRGRPWLLTTPEAPSILPGRTCTVVLGPQVAERRQGYVRHPSAARATKRAWAETRARCIKPKLRCWYEKIKCYDTAFAISVRSPGAGALVPEETYREYELTCVVRTSTLRSVYWQSAGKPKRANPTFPSDQSDVH